MPTDARAPAAPALTRLALRPPVWAVLLSLAVVAAVTADVLAGGLLTRLDHHISHVTRDDWGLRFRTWPRRALRMLTLFGQRGPILVVALPCAAWLAWRVRSIEPLARLAVALILLAASVYALKFGIGRAAPPDDGLRTATGQSFPSGHLANAVLVWGLLAWLAARYSAEVPRRVAAALDILRVAGPVLVVLGMTLLDYHWLTDFIAGAALGVILLWLATWPVAPRGRRGPGAGRTV